MVQQNRVEDEIPGGVYLCQVSEGVSCGACCGLYNVSDPSRENLQAFLSYRTKTFEGVARDVDAILSFKEHIESLESQTRPLPQFHHCPFIGLVGTRRLRVGCLLHPQATGNRGVDWRGLSFYGGMACRVYFCPSHHRLPVPVKQIVKETAQDWHRYGLVVTESEMLRAFFEAVESSCGRPVQVQAFLGNRRCVEALDQFLAMKPAWPFRDETGGPPIHYFFHDGLYEHPTIDYHAIGVAPSRYDAVLRALRSGFKSAKELGDAEELLDDVVDRITWGLRF